MVGSLAESLASIDISNLIHHFIHTLASVPWKPNLPLIENIDKIEVTQANFYTHGKVIHQ